MRFSIYQESKKGGRKNNQDRMGYCFTRDALLMVLADGMGGHLQGEMAAQIALQTIGARFQQQAVPLLNNPLRFLEESFLEAHREIKHYCSVNRLPESPRTTIVACVIQKGAAHWGHAGDSRLYWLRRGEIIAKTCDHSKIQTMIQQGLASPQDMETHPDRNQLFNCLGSPNLPTVELSRKMLLNPGDTLFLCSDGLWSAVPDQLIAMTFAKKTVMRAVPDLIHQALQESGAHADNVTGIAMAWEGADSLHEHGISTLTMPLGSLTTTIQVVPTSAFEARSDMLSDDDIQKAIDEIRETINRSKKTVPGTEED